MKEKIDVLDYAGEILKAAKSGVLLTTKADDQVNTMTISWGTLGIEWAVPIFTVFVREHRFTHSMLEKNPEFTINIPMGDFNKKILGVAGTKSGRDSDKISELNLHLETAEVISVPGIREAPLTLECRVIYKQTQDPEAIPEKTRDKFYPQDVDSSFCDRNRDFHTAYYGEIVAAYVIRPEE
ncbi:MAG: flavin reductase family protein [Lachnospiraceae bacterium]|nr:flavin reductase family protein [Lachnospiraceae bacterium]